ncbi:6396_t:CDS:2, partial [Racocetra fulgida]
KPVSQLLFALEKVSGLLILESNNLLCEGNRIDEYNDAAPNLFAFWKPIITNTKIVNIENLKIPYIITNKFYGLKLPFSTYFMEHINKFKSIYQDDLKMLKGIPENLDEETGNLKSHIIDDCVERLSEHIISVVPELKIPQFDLPNAYFNDFATIISHGRIDNSQILRQIISHHMNQEVPDPIRLHMACNENEQIKLQQWQRDIANILSISSNLSNSFNNPSLNMLRVYNDLSKSISLTQLFQIRQHAADLFSKQSIDIIFEKLDQIEKEKAEIKVLKSTMRLKVIETILSRKRNSKIAALCCDVIHMQLSKYQIPHYILMKAIDILTRDTKDTKELEKITAIALLKVFASEFWNCIEPKDSLNNPINYKFIDDLNK